MPRTEQAIFAGRQPSANVAALGGAARVLGMPGKGGKESRDKPFLTWYTGSSAALAKKDNKTRNIEVNRSKPHRVISSSTYDPWPATRALPLANLGSALKTCRHLSSRPRLAPLNAAKAWRPTHALLCQPLLPPTATAATKLAAAATRRGQRARRGPTSLPSLDSESGCFSSPACLGPSPGSLSLQRGGLSKGTLECWWNYCYDA